MTNFEPLVLPIEDFAVLSSKGDSQQPNFVFIIILLITISALFYMIYVSGKNSYYPSMNNKPEKKSSNIFQ